MAIATPFYEKTDEQKAILEMVRQFVDEQILPQAEHYDHEDEFPEPIVEQMKELGLFGITIPEEYGGMGLDLTTYAMIVEELSRGWISISGVVNTHFIGSYLLMKFGTDEQRQRLLPRMATGEIRAAFSLSEPELGSDVAGDQDLGGQDGDGVGDQRPEDVGHQRPALRPRLRARAHRQRLRDAAARHDVLRLREGAGRVREPGPDRPAADQEARLQGRRVDRAGLRRLPVPADMILGGEEAGLNKGFAQMMDALEVGRVNVAARGVGIAQRALELALRYAQERKAFGKPIAAAPGDPVQARRHGHQGRGRPPAHAQGGADEGRRRALGPRGRHGEAVRLRGRQGGRRGPFRIHGGYGYSKEYEIERLYRDAPLLLIGEGTSEIQRMVIGRKLLRRHKI